MLNKYSCRWPEVEHWEIRVLTNFISKVYTQGQYWASAPPGHVTIDLLATMKDDISQPGDSLCSHIKLNWHYMQALVEGYNI